MEASSIVSPRPFARDLAREQHELAQLALAAQLPLLTKQQLAKHYGFSSRWVEYQLVKGMPSRLIGGRRRFELGVVDRWLHTTYGGP